jgi:xylan 1,4-beta-xylosidase
MPELGKYNFAALDRSVETILKTGAKPLMCICFKPKPFFPQIDQDVVEPNN